MAFDRIPGDQNLYIGGSASSRRNATLEAELITLSTPDYSPYGAQKL